MEKRVLTFAEFQDKFNTPGIAAGNTEADVDAVANSTDNFTQGFDPENDADPNHIVKFDSFENPEAPTETDINPALPASTELPSDGGSLEIGGDDASFSSENPEGGEAPEMELPDAPTPAGPQEFEDPKTTASNNSDDSDTEEVEHESEDAEEESGEPTNTEDDDSDDDSKKDDKKSKKDDEEEDDEDADLTQLDDEEYGNE